MTGKPEAAKSARSERADMLGNNYSRQTRQKDPKRHERRQLVSCVVIIIAVGVFLWLLQATLNFWCLHQRFAPLSLM
jgi:hypothetical protein